MIINCPGPYIDTGTNMQKKNKFQILSSLLPHRLGGTWWIVFHEALYHHYKINSNLELSSLFPCIFEKNLNASIWYPHSVLPKSLLIHDPLDRASGRMVGLICPPGENVSTLTKPSLFLYISEENWMQGKDFHKALC